MMCPRRAGALNSQFNAQFYNSMYVKWVKAGIIALTVLRHMTNDDGHNRDSHRDIETIETLNGQSTVTNVSVSWILELWSSLRRLGQSA